MVDEEALIRQARRGDEAALAELLQRNYLAVRKYLITLTLKGDLADDLTQETMIRAIRSFGQFAGRSRFSTWLIAIATHQYVDHLRHETRERQRRNEAAELESALGTLEAVAGDGSSAWNEALVALATLPRDIALPIVLKHYYGYAYDQIAAVMGIPVGTVKSRVHNGIETMRKELANRES